MFINEVTIAGNLTRDPESRQLPSGAVVTNFSVATNRKWKGADGHWNEAVEFHNVVSYGKTAENIAKYFQKGKKIYLRGRLETKTWEKDGVKHYKTEIVLNEFQFVGENTKPAEEKEVPPSPERKPDVMVDNYPTDYNADDIGF